MSANKVNQTALQIFREEEEEKSCTLYSRAPKTATAAEQKSKSTTWMFDILSISDPLVASTWFGLRLQLSLSEQLNSLTHPQSEIRFDKKEIIFEWHHEWELKLFDQPSKKKVFGMTRRFDYTLIRVRQEPEFSCHSSIIKISWLWRNMTTLVVNSPKLLLP